MEARKKAKELVEKYISVNGNSFFAKDCALIAVDEMIEENNLLDNYKVEFTEKLIERLNYLNEVKQEIEKL